MISASLREFGYVVATAGTNAEALELAEKVKFDLFILDVRLPDGNGIELCQKVNQLQPNSPVVYHSAYASDKEQESALSICGDVYLKNRFWPACWKKRSPNCSSEGKSQPNSATLFVSDHGTKKYLKCVVESTALPERFRGWLSVIRMIYYAEFQEPVAQRLEQGTHNCLTSFCAGFHRVAQRAFHRCP
jgi:CheY-like chemotaxis protein